MNYKQDTKVLNHKFLRLLNFQSDIVRKWFYKQARNNRKLARSVNSQYLSEFSIHNGSVGDAKQAAPS